MNRTVKLSLLATAAVATVIIAGIGVGYFFRQKPDKQKNDRRVLTLNCARPEIPYHVSIQLDEKHICSGALISTEHVLTVAHCVAHFSDNRKLKKRVKIMVGAATVPCNSETFYGIRSVYIHRLYDRGHARNDIAVIKLMEKVALSGDVKQIDLPDEGAVISERLKLLVSGYSFNYPSWTLRKFDMRVSTMKSCLRDFELMDSIFCAFTSNKNLGCQSDLGRPAVIVNKYIIGMYVMSNVRGCGKRIPELYTEVSSHLKFIRDSMAGIRQ